MRIENLEKLPERQWGQAAEVLVEAFRLSPSAWDDLGSAGEEVATFLRPGRNLLCALTDDTSILV